MTGPHPDVAAVRLAVRTALISITAPGPVLVACSGGADSLALAFALAFEGPRASPPRAVGAVIVDQGWDSSPLSATRLGALAETLRAAGLDPVLTLHAPDPAQTETSARTARYEAYEKAIAETGAGAVLLGHTGSDQAEQVLLGLARGSGTRSLAGIPPTRGPYVRPLLTLARSVTVGACEALTLTPYVDPSNADPRHLRALVRTSVLPFLETTLGPGIAAALQRTAELARSDADALDAIAGQYSGDLSVASLTPLPVAVLRRVLLIRLRALGCLPTAEHLMSITQLVHCWRGQGPLQLPGGVQVLREGGRIILSAPSAPPKGAAPRD